MASLDDVKVSSFQVILDDNLQRVTSPLAAKSGTPFSGSDSASAIVPTSIGPGTLP